MGPAPAATHGAQADAIGLLAELSLGFAATLDVQPTVRAALSRIVSHVGAEAGSLFLLENEERELVCQACVGDPDITGFRVPAGQGIIGRSVREVRSQIVRDVSQDPAFHGEVDQATGFTTRSIICSPLAVKDECIGAIELVNKAGSDGRFADDDVYLLQVLAVSAALAILNARMAASLVDQERLRRELELAAEIQRNLLPEPRELAYPVHGLNQPVRTVSGDFFDHFELADGRVGFCLGDVSGKGMNAALLMAKSHSLYRCLGRTCDEPGLLLAKLNREICETSILGMFVTMVGGVFDPRTGRVRLSNAGHEPPLLHSGPGQFRAFEAGGPPLGILPEPAGDDEGFPEVEFDLEDAALYVFSDGLTEIAGHDGRPLEVQGVQAALEEVAELALSERLRRLVAGLPPERHDDLTILAVQAGGGV